MILLFLPEEEIEFEPIVLVNLDIYDLRSSKCSSFFLNELLHMSPPILILSALLQKNINL